MKATIPLLALALLAPAAQAQFHYFTGVDSYGNDLAELQGATLQECEFTCLKVTDCRAFTYNVRYSTCFLKSAPNPEPTLNHDAITGLWHPGKRPLKIRLR